MKRIAVLDIGKTNVKLALVDALRGEEIHVAAQPNPVRPGPPYPHFDTDAIWAFVRRELAALAGGGIDAIAVTTHGACAALLQADGALAAPVLDYEHPGPDECRAGYDRIRPDFARTGSPALPMGLNLGAQLFWQFSRDPDLLARTAHVVTWPQYWAWRLTGQLACDLSSLGCHTDLWDPFAGTWSDLPQALGIAAKLAPPRKPGDVLGPLLPALQGELGLGPVPVICGIHDSNASLVPHLSQPAPFSVVSTGTWVICMAVGGSGGALDPLRDTLVNVNARGAPVPSARFMGGREYEIIREGRPLAATPADAASVHARALMLMPAVVPGSGPFADRRSFWTDSTRSDGETEVALGYYLALMTATCLGLIGAEGPALIEGPFAGNPWYCAMLASATGRPVQASAARTGTALGAAALLCPPRPAPLAKPALPEPALAAYAARWRQQLIAG